MANVVKANDFRFVSSIRTIGALKIFIQNIRHALCRHSMLTLHKQFVYYAKIDVNGCLICSDKLTRSMINTTNWSIVYYWCRLKKINIIMFSFLSEQCPLNGKYSSLFCDALFWISINIIFCPHTECFSFFSVDNSPITSCTRSTKYRPFISVDFTKFNRPCNCTVIPSFVGELLVISNGVTIKECTTHIKVTNDFLFGCPTKPFASVHISVQNNQPVDVRAEYLSSYTSEPFYHCLGFKQNGKYASMYKVSFFHLKACFFILRLNWSHFLVSFWAIIFDFMLNFLLCEYIYIFLNVISSTINK